MATVRNIEDLKLDEITEEFLTEQAIAMGEELGVDTNQGSIYRDACDGHVTRTSDFFDDLRSVREITSIYTCTGDILDEKMLEHAIARKPPADTPATYNVTFVGAFPEVGDLVSCDGYFFNVAKDSGGNWVIVSQDAGTEMNTLVPGLPVIPERDVDNMISATLGTLAVPAVDMEDDDSARARLLDRISASVDVGSAAHLRSLCEDITGVGRARIVKLWDGPGTVKGVIISDAGTAPTTAVVELVQETMDPDAAGLGEGLVSIGCFFTAVAAVEVPIDISVSVAKSSTATLAGIQEELEEAAAEYLKSRALESEEGATVRINAIGAMISDIEGVIDYDALALNSDASNVEVTLYQVPVLGEVTLSEYI